MTCYLNALGMVCALGNDVGTIRANLFAGSSPGMRVTEHYSPGRALMLGTVADEVPPLRDAATAHCSRNNALLAAALLQLQPQLDTLLAGTDPARVAVVIGSSTSGIAEGEAAIDRHAREQQFPPEFQYAQQELGSPADFLATRLASTGPAYVISTACSSGARALASGARLLAANMADVVIAGGVDSLCRFTVAGFGALESVATARCNPLSANRNGINIGEGAALFVMTRSPAAVKLAGWGEGSDGHHISAPDPTGGGAHNVIAQALSRAGLRADGIGYINLHGTATRQNDAMEARVVSDLLPGVPCSSTKPLTGHALAGAGAIEAGLCWITLTDPLGRLPPHLWDEVADIELPALAPVAPHTAIGTPPRAVLSNSFAFGGNNIALVLARA